MIIEIVGLVGAGMMGSLAGLAFRKRRPEQKITIDETFIDDIKKISKSTKEAIDHKNSIKASILAEKILQSISKKMQDAASKGEFSLCLYIGELEDRRVVNEQAKNLVVAWLLDKNISVDVQQWLGTYRVTLDWNETSENET